MISFKADLHIHTVLSPCGDVEMSPVNIVNQAVNKKLDIIGITDHNSTLHCELIKNIAAKHLILVLMGVEVTSKEEIHCLAYFEHLTELKVFQQFLDEHASSILNNAEKFGYQLVVNEKEEVLQEIQPLLIAAINKSIDEIAEKVHELNGILIPAHIDKSRNSVISQLGFIPSNIKFDAVEVSPHYRQQKNIFLKNYNNNCITSSDAHYLHQIGNVHTEFIMKEKSFKEIKKALITNNYKPIFQSL